MKDWRQVAIETDQLERREYKGRCRTLTLFMAIETSACRAIGWKRSFDVGVWTTAALGQMEIDKLLADCEFTKEKRGELE
jgi:hypothetical protein